MLPEQFLQRMQDMLGEEYTEFIHSFEGEHYRGLRINMRKSDVKDFLAVSPFALTQVPWTINGFYYSDEEQPGKHPFHEAGVYYIQEPSAMAPVPFLEVKPGERVLDLCAAPGGKTTQLADALLGDGLLVSNEIHPARAKILSENVERMGVRNCMVTNETSEKLATVFPAYFDKILVDAPCSGEGMFRKNDEACNEWSPENVALCADRQDEVLDNAAIMLSPGGRIVYSTCTFAPKEDEGSVSRFLERHPDFHIVEVRVPGGFERGRRQWYEGAGPEIEKTLRLMPHKVKGEGHYLAVLEKEGMAGSPANSRGGCEKSIPEKEYKEFLDFAKEYLEEDFFLNRKGFAGTFIRFGEQLYVGPENMPALKGLKVLRPGLHLGTIKKGRFEPSHALALAIGREDVKQYLNLSADDPVVKGYLNGQTIILDGEEKVMKKGKTDEIITDGKGWCLICTEGFSLGWGKLAGSVMKNHYPKGLRKG